MRGKRIVPVFLSALMLPVVTLCACSTQKNTESSSKIEVTTAAQTTTEQITTAEITVEEPSTETSTTKEQETAAPVTDTVQNDSWKQIYSDYVNSLSNSDYYEYALVYVDEDDIPELYMHGKQRPMSSELCWIYNDEVYSQRLMIDQSDITLDLSNRTLVINEALKRGCEGRLNFTIAHEIAHHIIDVVCGANYSIKFRQLPHFERPGNRFSLDYDEYMANQLAAALLMPDVFVDTVFYKLFETERVKRIHSILDKIAFKKLCAMAALFGVSKSALAIRLQKKGMLGEYIFAGYENLLDIFPDTEESVA